MIYHQSVFEPWPIKDKSVQAIITSPPYWGIRKYDIPDIIIGEWAGQYGLEPTIKLYVEHTLLWVSEAMRVLKDDGVLFLNLGDTYGTVSGNMGGSMTESKITNLDSINHKQSNIGRHKCKLLIPHRVAIALCDERGLILRNDIIWHKPNSMPESTTDRFSKKFESIFMFTKNPRYYFDLDAVREKALPLNRWGGPKLKAKGKSKWDKGTGQSTYRDRDMQPNNGMKNPGDMWSINTRPSPEKHYAMWPEKLVERMVRCSTRSDDIVLDPFCGSGTTLRVAEQINRKGMGIDLGYEEIQERRLNGIQRELI